MDGIDYLPAPGLDPDVDRGLVDVRTTAAVYGAAESGRVAGV